MNKGYEFFSKILQNPQHFVAPMVDQSELAWRLLSRKFQAQVTVTPMFHAKLFVTSEKYRQEHFQIHSLDAPLIVQFCANDPEWFYKAAMMVQDDCVAVDLNLGCPQNIAKRGYYGSFLQDDWERIESIVRKATELPIPITCKIRIFSDVKKSIEYAQMLERAGCCMLTVHGRLREQRGQKTGIADWDQIKAIKESISIPVIANGNILYYENVQECIKYTKVDGVMSAEGNLYNPGIFQDKMYASWYLCETYLDICNNVTNSATPGQAKAHVFKILHSSLKIHTDLRDQLARVKTFQDIEEIVQEMKKRIIQEFGDDVYYSKELVKVNGIYELPHWVAQPYIRPVTEPAAITNPDMMDPTPKNTETNKRTKQEKNNRKVARLLCQSCPNVRSKTSDFCKVCLKKSQAEPLEQVI